MKEQINTISSLDYKQEFSTRDSIADIWGSRTPYFGEWPQRVDERYLGNSGSLDSIHLRIVFYRLWYRYWVKRRSHGGSPRPGGRPRQ